MDAIEARGEAALVYDTSGEFIAQYHDSSRSDIILNPFDSRNTYWNPFAEIKHPADAQRIATYLVPQSDKEQDPVWTQTARMLVANVMLKLQKENRATLPDLLDVLQNMQADDLRDFVAGTSSARTFAKDADKATASCLFMLGRACDLLKFLWAQPHERGSFSFRDYFEKLDSHKGAKPWIFVPRKEEHFEAVKPLMAAWLSCAASACLALPPSDTRRMWFILDELPDLPRVENLTRLLPEGRKFGVSVVITFQAIGQMHKAYGKDSAEAMLGCCNTKLYLQTIDKMTRQWCSDTIGDVEAEIGAASDTKAQGKKSQTQSLSRQTRPAILESEFRLPPYQGFLQLPDGLPVARVRLTDTHIKARGAARNARFIPVDERLSLYHAMGEAMPPAQDIPEGLI